MGIRSLKEVIERFRLRRRFSKSIIYPHSSVDNQSKLGDYSVLFCNVDVIDTSLGAYTYVQSGSSIYNAEIGKFCSIARNVTIGLASHPTFMVSTSPVFYDNKQPLPEFFINSQLFTTSLPRTHIGADVWIGQGVMIKAGIKVGVGAVIGAGSVVTKDVAPYSISAGNPCRHIRYRFSDNVCEQLQKSRWWELEEVKLKEIAQFFYDPVLLLEKLHG